jgi:nucleotide-binding universal stress UspA family protein
MVVRLIAREERGVMRVLLAVDDSGFAEDLLRAVVVGIRHENTEVLVLHVLQPVDTVPPPEMAQGYAPELEDEKQPARVLVERIAAELRKAGFAAQTGVRIGDVANTILAQAVEWDADLIAVGSHGQRSIHDFSAGERGGVGSSSSRMLCGIVRVSTSPQTENRRNLHLREPIRVIRYAGWRAARSNQRPGGFHGGLERL